MTQDTIQFNDTAVEFNILKARKPRSLWTKKQERALSNLWFARGTLGIPSAAPKFDLMVSQMTGIPNTTLQGRRSDNCLVDLHQITTKTRSDAGKPRATTTQVNQQLEMAAPAVLATTEDGAFIKTPWGGLQMAGGKEPFYSPKPEIPAAPAVLFQITKVQAIKWISRFGFAAALTTIFVAGYAAGFSQ